MSSFKEQLQQNTKTPSQILDEQWRKDSERAIEAANSMYNQIKKELMNKAQNGEYCYVNGKRHISVDIESSYVKMCIKREDNTRYYKKLFSYHYRRIDNRIDYTFVPNEQYKLYMETLHNLVESDDIKVSPSFYEHDIMIHRKITLPYAFTKITNATHKVSGHIQATIEY